MLESERIVIEQVMNLTIRVVSLTSYRNTKEKVQRKNEMLNGYRVAFGSENV